MKCAVSIKLVALVNYWGLYDSSPMFIQTLDVRKMDFEVEKCLEINR